MQVKGHRARWFPTTPSPGKRPLGVNTGHLTGNPRIRRRKRKPLSKHCGHFTSSQSPGRGAHILLHRNKVVPRQPYKHR